MKKVVANKRNLFVLLLLLVAMLFFFIPISKGKVAYHKHTGEVFGTYFHITYSNEEDLNDSIDDELQRFGEVMNAFDSTSMISLINSNKEVVTNELFEHMYDEAARVASLTHGAFDITVAPLVNAWGFGFKKEVFPTREQIDSIKEFVGYKKVKLAGHHIIKSDARIMLDAAAIAKGYAVDVVAEYLQQKGCENYLVEIGGEIVCHGVSEQGKRWTIGINRPNESPLPDNDIQQVLQSSEMAMATSGNYRQFYYKEGERYSHTIDPRTGFPVEHSLLSATIIAPKCMTADAFATACMVLGLDSAMRLCEESPELEGYFIYTQKDSTLTVYTKGFEQYMKK